MLIYIHFIKMKGIHFAAIDKETQYREELPDTAALSLKRIS